MEVLGSNFKDTNSRKLTIINKNELTENDFQNRYETEN